MMNHSYIEENVIIDRYITGSFLPWNALILKNTSSAVPSAKDS